MIGARFFKTQWFLICLVAVLAVGMNLPLAYVPVAQLQWLSQGVVAITMFLMAWPIETSQLWRTLSRPWAAILGSAISLGICPPLFGLMAPFFGPEIGPGVIILGATPSTLASAAVWTRRGGGNDVVALMVTLITNSLCFLITPTWVYLFARAEIPSELFYSTIGKLFLLVVVPLFLGQIVRLNRRSAVWATSRTNLLGIFAQCGVLAIAFVGAIQTSQRLADQPQSLPWGTLATLVLTLASAHLLIWGLSYWGSGRLGFAAPERLAIAFSGSQKTLMVGLSTAIALHMSMIPLVIYHFCQLLIDTLIADRFRALSQVPASNRSA